MSELVRCDLCGTASHDVRERLVAWTEAVQRAANLPTWDSVNRCPDYQACRRRVEERGGTWPVRDAVTRPTVTQPTEREEVPV